MKLGRTPDLTRRPVTVLILLAGLTLLAGCGSAVKGAPPAPAPAPAHVEPSPYSLANFQLARSFAGPDTIIEPVPTAVLLLSEKADTLRNEAVCKAFLSLPPSEDLRSQVVEPNLIVTRMLLKTQTPDPNALADCNYLLKIYDYARAQQWIENLGLKDSNGPFFVVLFPPDAETQSRPIVALDASELGAEKLGGLTALWRSALSMVHWRPTVAEPQECQSSQGWCKEVGNAVRIATPVLIAIGGSALVAEYPAVGIVIAAIKEKDPDKSLAAWFKSKVGDISKKADEMATSGCMSVASAIRKFFVKDGAPAARECSQ